MSFHKETDHAANIIQMSKEGYEKLLNVEDGKNLHWTTDLNTELPIKMSSTGIGSTIKPETIPQVFRKTAYERQDGPALRVMRNDKEYIWSWNEWWSECRAFAKSLEKVGCDERKAVNIMGFNAPEWAIAYFGAIFHNNVVSGVYITNGAQACQYQAQNSEAQVIVLDTLEQLK